MMASNLKTLGLLLSHDQYIEASKDMVDKVNRMLMLAPQDLANWASLYALNTYPTAEVVAIDNNTKASQLLSDAYFPNKVIAGKASNQSSELELLEGREMINNQPTYFVCYNKACQLPVHSSKEVFEQMEFSMGSPQ